MPRSPSARTAGVVLILGWLAILPLTRLTAKEDRWIGTWGASPSPQLSTEADILAAQLTFLDQTLRQIVHTSIGGSVVRVRLSNAYGKETVQIAAAHLAVSAGGGAIVPGSDLPLTFGGSPTAVLPADAVLLSDPVELTVPPDGDLSVSLYFKSPVSAAGIHYRAMQTAYVAPGDLTAAEVLPAGGTLSVYAFLTRIEVLAPSGSATLVTFGDSITDGALSSPAMNRRWPNLLARRLLSRTGEPLIGVVNSGIGGNRLLHDPAKMMQFGVNGLARFDRDVLTVPGVGYVILLEGINDIGHPGGIAPIRESVTPNEIIGAMKQLITRAHDHGIKIFGATLLPFADTTHVGYFNPGKETTRQVVNAWIRTSTAFDGVIDFDLATRDAMRPDQLLPLYDSGDHLHPNDRGYQAMAEAIELSLFKP